MNYPLSIRNQIHRLLFGLYLAVLHMSGGANFVSAAEMAKPGDDRFLGLPPGAVARMLADTEEARRLGAKLFADVRLSISETIACQSCHRPDQGFTVSGRRTPRGGDGKPLRRNAPGLFNVSLARRFFHDGRSPSLEDQALAPLVDVREMANPSVAAVVQRISRLPDYKGFFEHAFARPVSALGISEALAAFQRGLLAGGSAFDRWKYGADAGAMSPGAIRGLGLFRGKAACAACHLIGKGSAGFLDDRFHNTGAGWRHSPPVGERDLGRAEATGNRSDRFKFKTPTLRNIALTAPYMHDGSLAGLGDVVRFYNVGGIRNPTIDPLIRRLGLTDREIADVVAFLESLTSPWAVAISRR